MAKNNKDSGQRKNEQNRMTMKKILFRQKRKEEKKRREKTNRTEWQ